MFRITEVRLYLMLAIGGSQRGQGSYRLANYTTTLHDQTQTYLMHHGPAPVGHTNTTTVSGESVWWRLLGFQERCCCCWWPSGRNGGRLDRLATAAAAAHHVTSGVRVALPVAGAVVTATTAHATHRVHVAIGRLQRVDGGPQLTRTLHADVLVHQRLGQVEHAQLALDAVVALRHPYRSIEQGQLLLDVLGQGLLRQNLTRLLVPLPLLHSVIVVFRSAKGDQKISK